jgi:hypothetical protein
MHEDDAVGGAWSIGAMVATCTGHARRRLKLARQGGKISTAGSVTSRLVALRASSPGSSGAGSGGSEDDA